MKDERRCAPDEQAGSSFMAGRAAPASSFIRRVRGFTLVELLVSLLVLSIIAAMAWQGVDGIVRSRDIAEQRLDRQLRLQSVIAQWDTDLGELQDVGVVPALTFDGANLRVTRRSANGVQLVVWSLRGNGWTRWSAPPVTQSQALQEHWLRSQQLLGNEPGQLRALGGVAQWQVYFWRGNAWTNAQSSGDLAEAPTPVVPGAINVPRQEVLPEGVRLVLEFTEDSGSTGTLTRDLRLGPQQAP
jgi:general secretion pathway protein J